MVSEEKVKIMTRLALYERKEGKALKAGKYYRKDFISLNMIWTGILVTLCYVLMIIVGLVYKTDYLMNNITEIDSFSLGKKLIVIYIALLAIYMLLAYIVYTVRFKVIQEGNKTYTDGLKKLCKIYRKEQNESGSDNKLGGTEEDDETIGF